MSKVKHIVMWKFRRDGEIPHSEVAMSMKKRLEALAGKIPGLLSIEVGINVKESEMAYDAVLVSEFTDFESLSAYKTNPLHVPISNFCKEHRTDRRVVDYLTE